MCQSPGPAYIHDLGSHGCSGRQGPLSFSRQGDGHLEKSVQTSCPDSKCQGEGWIPGLTPKLSLVTIKGEETYFLGRKNVGSPSRWKLWGSQKHKGRKSSPCEAKGATVTIQQGQNGPVRPPVHGNKTQKEVAKIKR